MAALNVWRLHDICYDWYRFQVSAVLGEPAFLERSKCLRIFLFFLLNIVANVCFGCFVYMGADVIVDN